MNGKTGLIYTPENMTDQVAGEYSGYATCMESGIGLESDAETYEDLIYRNEAKAFITKINKREVNIRIQIKGLPDFVFQNNLLFKDASSEKLLIEGDWLIEWGIIGWIDMVVERLLIDINPVNYLKMKSSGIRPEQLVSRYVMQEADNDCRYKTVFSLEFEGMRSQ